MLYTFENCTLDTSLRTLQCAGQTVRLRPKALQVCLYLLEHRDRAVSKDELMEQTWPDQFISEATLTSTIREVRQALGDSGRTQRVIQSLYGYGYRFVAAVMTSPTTSEIDDDQNAACAAVTPLAQPIPDDPHTSNNHPHPVVQPPPPSTTRSCEALGEPLDEDDAFADRHTGDTLTPLVGREQELAALKAWLQHAEQGQGHAVGLVGPPGIGKSRLLATFCEMLHEKSITTLEVSCQPFGQMVPFFSVRALAMQYCQIAETDTIEAMTAKVAHHLQVAGLLSEECTNTILHLLGLREAGDRLSLLHPEMVRVRLLATLRQMFISPHRQQPLAVIIHDLHWIDVTSAMWLSSLIDCLADTSTLILTTYHVGYQPPWIASPEATELSLPPLSSQFSLNITHAIRPPIQLSDTLAQAIVAQANGNPLFLGVLTRLVGKPGREATDFTLAASPQAAIDLWFNRLAVPVKRLLQTASVIGQNGAVSLLQHLWNHQPAPEVLLAEVEGQWLHTIPAGAGEPCFRFTHRLMHDVVYASLDASERQHLHAAVVQALEEQVGVHLTSVAHLLAWHATHSQQAATAIRYLSHIAEQATSYFAHIEAIQCLQQAQTLLPWLPLAQQPTCRLELLLCQAQSLIAMQRWQEATNLLFPTELSRVPDDSLAARHALLLSQASSGLGAWERAAQHALHAVEIVTASQDNATMEQAYRVLAMAYYSSGRPLLGINYSRQAIALLQAPAASSRHAMTQIVLGLNALLLGDMNTALEAASEAETIATTLGESHLQTYATWLLGWIHAAQGASNKGISACQRSLTYAVDPLNTAFALGWLGYAYLEHGDPAAAIPNLEQAVRQMRQRHYPRMAGLYTAFVAEALYAQQQFDLAHERAQQALTQCQTTTYAFGIGWTQRTLGRIALATEELTVGTQHLADALATFTALPARFEMGRTHLDLAASTNSQHHRNTVVRHVTEAYHLFQSLHVQPYVERVVRLAHDIGLSPLPGIDH